MLLNMLLSFCIGAFVGVAAHIQKNGKLIKPRKTKRFIYLGFFEDVIMGSLAAVLVVLSANPESVIAVIVTAMIAGLGGEAILKGLDLLKLREKKE
ncbi:DUF4257 domain-containing protein [Cytobacillus gottheilii]|uniref:DUF4257 domain-containing protein n=1 Tax=Cytobacillus gottheilii TaxID=859144 RepID=UPI000831F63A|nr:DUF4257 domain-containing protein [Cytobacillus gottheilii]